MYVINKFKKDGQYYSFESNSLLKIIEEASRELQLSPMTETQSKYFAAREKAETLSQEPKYVGYKKKNNRRLENQVSSLTLFSGDDDVVHDVEARELFYLYFGLISLQELQHF